MSKFHGSAPGKVILFGEHAVVYGQPAIAVPVAGVQALAEVDDDPKPHEDEFVVEAQDLGERRPLASLPDDHPLAAIVRHTLDALGIASPPPVVLRLRSSIPIASGLGSGAAVSTAIVRALSAVAGRRLDDAQVSALVFEVEKIHHGTPSGIDNTVIAMGEPVYFVRGLPPERFRVAAPFSLAIGDTGVSSPTRLTVGDVRAAWQRDPARWQAVFRAIGDLARAARAAIEAGQPDRLGGLMGENQALLRQLDVSSPELERLIAAAIEAGAAGAKLSGGGRGGNMIALVDEATAPRVRDALREAGARGVIVTRVG